MGQKTRFPLIVDETPGIETKVFKEAGFFIEGRFNTGEMTIQLKDGNGILIQIVAAMHKDPALVFQYEYEYQQRQEIIRLKARPSNMCLGSNIYSFICPISGMVARKLLFIDGRFVHRSIVKGALYRSQTRSHKYREMTKKYGPYLDTDNILTTIVAPHFKKYHKVKRTKKYARLLDKLKKSEDVSSSELMSDLLEWEKQTVNN